MPKRKKDAVINQKGVEKFSSMWWVCFFFPLTIWTLQLALAKDARRPVCTYERCSFVIPTLPHFQNLLCPVVFLSAGGTLSSVGGVPSEMETVFGLLLVPWSNLPRLPFPSVDCGLDLQ